ncbi:DoxX family membrane protein [Streptomyces sp. RKND-216]|uniref:DoxX family protein n=1 Tax=Streptomyces sp. RKND-216 TaxID=2562581 RepID=UPI00109DDAD7|nr:DoxX family protein [Streptomyces sp. RKND-216]THA24414.1 DoxX family membrane protein [Streptomyces sp. RKND-216]
MILRRVARPLLAATFVYGGISALRAVEAHAQAAKPVLDQTVGRYEDQIPDNVPTDAETLVKIDAAVKIAAGSALAFGKAPRAAALFLLGSLIPTTAATHRFWEESDPEAREQQLVHFLKNCGLAGGLLLAAADTHGKPSAAWLARHGAHTAGKRIGTAGHAAELYAVHALKHHKKNAKRGAKLAKSMGKGGTRGKVFGRSKKSGLQKVQHAVLDAQHAVLEAQHDGMRKGRKAWGKSRKHGLKKAQHSLAQAQKQRDDLAKKARQGARQAKKSDLAKKARDGVKQARKADLAKTARHSARQARTSDLGKRAEHRVRAAQHVTQARAEQARGYARGALSH